MSAQHARPSPAIDLAELQFGLAFGSSAEEIADFLQRDVEDVRHKAAVEAQRVLPGALSRSSSSRISALYFREFPRHISESASSGTSCQRCHPLWSRTKSFAF
jgi:hypothetical protein